MKFKEQIEMKLREYKEKKRIERRQWIDIALMMRGYSIDNIIAGRKEERIRKEEEISKEEFYRQHYIILESEEEERMTQWAIEDELKSIRRKKEYDEHVLSLLLNHGTKSMFILLGGIHYIDAIFNYENEYDMHNIRYVIPILNKYEDEIRLANNSEMRDIVEELRFAETINHSAVTVCFKKREVMEEIKITPLFTSQESIEKEMLRREYERRRSQYKDIQEDVLKSIGKIKKEEEETI